MKDLKLTERHIFKGYWWLPDTETSSRQGFLERELCLAMGNGRNNPVWTTGNRYNRNLDELGREIEGIDY